MDQPRSEIHDWDLSFAAALARSTGQNRFRFRDGDGGEWLVSEIMPDAGVHGPCAYSYGEHPDNPNHLLLKCGLRVIDGIAYLSPPSAEEVQEDEYEVAEDLGDSHFRICARLSNDDWRFRNERMGLTSAALHHVNGVKGWINANWLDGGTHIFHDGRAFIDSENFVRLPA